MEKPHWTEKVKTYGMAEPLDLMLKIIEPLAPFAAQVLYVTQPVFGALGLQEALVEIAQALEEPDGVDGLRQRLRD